MPKIISRLAFDNFDFFVGQIVELINRFINLRVERIA